MQQYEREKLLKSLADKEISVEDALKRLSLGKKETSVELLLKDDSLVANGHIVYDSKILIGVMHLSLLLQKEYEQKKEFPLGLKKFMLHEKVELNNQEIVNLQVDVDKNQLEVKAKSNFKDTWFSVASAQSTDEVKKLSPRQLNPARLNSELIFEGNKLYEVFAENGVRYQAPLVTVQKIVVDQETTYAELYNDHEFLSKGSFHINPAFADGAIISSFFGAFLNSDDRSVYIPLFIGKISCFGKTTNRCFSVSTLKKVNEEIAIFDISIYDENYQEVLLLDDVSCKRIAQTTATSKKKSTPITNPKENNPVEVKEYSEQQAPLLIKLKSYLINNISELISGNTLTRNRMLSTNFMDLGIESEALIHLTEKIESDLNVELYPTIFFEYQNINEISRYFMDEFEENMKGFLNKFNDEEAKEVGVKAVLKAETKQESKLQFKPEIKPLSKRESVLQEQLVREGISEIEPDEIAIVGMAGRFSDADTINEFWDNIMNQTNMMTEVPESRWNIDEHYDPDKKVADKSYCKYGSFINDVDKFDPLFFNISPREAKMMDPQMRHLLQNLYHTAENAGLVSQIRGSNTGMYVGVCFSDYQTESLLNAKKIDPFDGIGNAPTMLANRPSFYFDLKGPSLSIDTACSSSLVALDLACEAIKNGTCDMAFAAGVNLLLSAWHYKYFSSIGALSETGRCHSFDSRADGYTPGEAIASVLLKPLSKALVDGDPIHGIIKGTAVKHGGYTNSITAPSAKTQSLVLKKAWENAKILPEQIGYIEAHGTGTKLGDPIEIEALKMAFGRNKETKNICRVGSVKSNIGHAEGAAGISGLIKAMLCIQHRYIPAMPKFEELNPYIKIKNSPFVIDNVSTEWKSDKPLIAGVSSFGFGGTYAHVILEEAPQRDVNRIVNSGASKVFLLSAKAQESLIQNVKNIVQFIEQNQNNPNVSLSNISYSLMTGREVFSERLLAQAKSLNELKTILLQYIDGDTSHVQLSCTEESEIHDRLLTRFELENKIDEFVDLWLKGAGIDVKDMKNSNKGTAQMISLPGYAFLKEPYWYELNGETHTTVKKNLENYAFSPELAQVKEVFVKLDKSQLIVREHVIKGRLVLPGVANMELIIQSTSAALSLDTKKLSIRSLILLAPVIVEEEAKLTLEIKDTRNDIRVVLTQDEKTVAICSIEENFKPLEETIDVENLKNHSDFTISRNQIYDLYSALDISYGDSFKGISKIWASKSEVLAYIELPKTSATSQKGYVWNPFLMDAMIQSSLGLQEANLEENQEAYMMLPYKFTGVHWYKKQPQKCWVHIEVIKGDIGSKSCVLSVKAYNPSNELVFVVERLTLKYADRLKAPSEEKVVPSYLPGYRYEWQQIYEIPVREISRNKATKGVFLWIYNNKNQRELLQNRFEKPNMDIIYVQIGLENTVYENSYTIIPKEEDFSAFFNQIGHCDEILWLAENSEVPKDIIEVSKQHDQTTMALFHFINALHKKNLENKDVAFKLITINAELTEKDITLNVNLSAMKGMTKVMPKDIPWLKVGLLDIDVKEWNSGNEEVIHTIEKLPVKKLFSEYVIRNNDVYQQRKIEFENITIQEKQQDSQVVANGNYVVVGGIGGLGTIYCKWLVSQAKVQLFLIGSSALDDNKEKQLSEYRKKGSKASYIQVDITSEEACNKAIKALHLDKIDELVFSVIRLDDQLITDISEADFSKALSPKITGTWSVYFATQNIPVNSVVFFSSINTDIAGKLQSSYVAGCSFENNFAKFWETTRQGKIKVINWGFWEETGIVAKKEHKKVLESVGVLGIKNNEGTKYLQTALNISHGKICVAKLNKNIKDLLQVSSGSIDASIREVHKFETAKFIKSGFPVQSYIKSRMLFNEYIVLLIANFLKSFGKHQLKSIDTFVNAQSIRFEYQKLIRSAFELLVARDYLSKTGDEYGLTHKLAEFSQEQQQQIKQKLLKDSDEYIPYFNLLDTCVEQLLKVANGSESAANVLFPNGSMELVNKIYQGNRIMDYYNELIAQIIKKCMQVKSHSSSNEKATHKILEIGAGTGGTSKAILQELKNSSQEVEYYYTDISSAFLHFGRKTFEEYNFVEYEILDIENLGAFGDQHLNSFDIVIASNVIHATKTIANSLNNIRGLLKKGGSLILNEMIESNPFNTFTFGLTKGWWNFEDTQNRLPLSPALSINLWQSILYKTGFSNIQHYGLNNLLGDNESMQVFMAESESTKIVPNTIKTKTVVDSRNLKKAVQTISNSAARKEEIITYLINIFSEVLQIPSQRISQEKTYDEYGVDSITGQELVERLKQDIPKLNPVILFECTNIQKLASFLVEEFPDFLAEVQPVEMELPKPLVDIKDVGLTALTPPKREITFKQIEKAQTEPSGKRNLVDLDEIAIIGMAGKYPDADDLEEFWENLKAGKNCIREIPEDRWESSMFFDTDKKKQTTTYSKWGGFIRDIDKFDAGLFSMSRIEAELTDPQIRLFLENVWTLMENAGYTPTTLGEDVGVFVGVMSSQYQLLGAEETARGNLSIPNCGYWAIANRASYCFDFHGPSIAIDSACSSSLTALHLACKSILDNECESAVVGGINLILHPSRYIQYSQFNMLASNDQCKTFDESADGFVDGEGVGSILIKSKQKAIKDGDFIYATIKGTTINSGGKSAGFTVPDITRQSELIKRNIENSGVNPLDISYVEAHGTGTPLGDPVEVRALTKAFGQEKKQYCAIGSVKSNIGHLEAAAGIASLSKVLLQFQKKTLVPSINFNYENPKIQFKETPFFVQKSCAPWPSNGQKSSLRLAAISSFGAGGSNAHTILEEYENNWIKKVQNEEQLILVSSDKKDLIEKAAKFKEFLSKRVEIPYYTLQNIAKTLQLGRVHHKYRLCFKVTSVQHLLHVLGQYIEGEKNISELFTGVAKQQNNLSNASGLQDIAVHWVAGGIVDWNKLSNNSSYLKVQLPGHLYRKDRYWLDQVTAPVEERSAVIQKSQFWDKNLSTLDGLKFVKKFNGKEEVLKDHEILGKFILPGVIYLELFRKAISEVYPSDPVVKINGFILASPVVYENELKEVILTINPAKGRFTSEVSSVIDGEVQLHAMGKLVLKSQQKESLKAPAIDINDIISRCTKILQGKEVYQTYKSLGLKYGASFQGIQKVHCGNLEALSFLKLQGNVPSESVGFHHTLLDGALQTIIGVQLNVEEQDNKVFLPFSFKSFESYAPLQIECIVYAKVLTNKYVNDDQVYGFDITIYDEFGNPLATFHEFTVRMFDPSLLENKKKTEIQAPSEKIYIPKWELDPNFKLKDAVPLNLLNSLIFCDLPEYLALIKDRADIIVVQSGDQFEWKSENGLSIDPSNPKDYQRLFSELLEKNIAIEQVIHLWNYTEDRLPLSEFVDETLLDRGVRSLFLSYQALMKNSRIKNIPFFYCFTKKKHHYYEQTASVLTKVFSKEHPKGNLRSVEFDQQYSLSNLLRFLQYEKTINVQSRIQIKQEKRYVEFFYTESFVKESLNPLSSGNRVVIVGGHTGVGKLFTQHFVETYEAKVIAMGRRILKGEELEQLESLGNGGQVTYVSTDVNDSNAVKLALEKIRELGEIHGVIHAGGIVEDQFLIQKSIESFNRVLSPKVHGTIHLDELTKDDPLKFFVTFSSLAGIFGNVGQGDYSVANSFMDAYMKYRDTLSKQKQRSGKSVTINWPYWEEGGMRLEEEYLTMMRKQGLETLETSRGLSLFDMILTSDSVQNVVALGDDQRVLLMLNNKEFARTVVQTKKKVTTNDAFVLEKVVEIVTQSLSESLKIDPNELDPEVDVADFGMDSILMMRTLDKIETSLDVVIDPNLLIENTTILGISEFIMSNYQDELETLETALVKTKSNIELVAQQETKVESKKEITPQERPVTHKSSLTNTNIAVIGMACRFPGANSIDEFWSLLQNGISAIETVPKQRWTRTVDNHKGAILSVEKDDLYGAFIDNYDAFDAEYFNLSDQEALVMDPQQRILLELSQEVIDHAGYTREELNGSKTGVYIGGTASNYIGLYENELTQELSKYSIVNNIQNMMAARISDFYNFKGYSGTVDTACSSSLVSIHQAMESIQAGSCDMAMAGGVSLLLDDRAHQGFASAEVLSKDGKVKVFDESADGFTLGEGGGLVLLKDYEKALQHGDQILAVIKGSAVNNDGKTMGVTTPNRNAQKDVIRDAVEKAQINVANVGYLEAHGTGTLLGDPIEIQAATQVYREFTDKKGYCGTGSVKTNMGHMLTAAGVCGFMKVVLTLNRGKIPPSLNCENPHPRFKFDRSPFFPVQQLSNWKAQEGDRLAGISSFGFGGTNCHMILQDYVGNSIQRNPIQGRKFNRKRYCLGKEIIPVSDNELLNIFARLKEKSITVEEAKELIHKINAKEKNG